MISTIFKRVALIVSLGIPLLASGAVPASSKGSRAVPPPASAAVTSDTSTAPTKASNTLISKIVTKTAPARTAVSDTVKTLAGRLARVTAYWPSEGDYYTRHSMAATGVRLHDGHCAVDPNVIPYGSVVEISGVGKFLAVDTGSAVRSRTAAKEGGHTSAQRNALVIDLFFENRRAGERFASSESKWVAINWWAPNSTASQARQARSLFAEEDWGKIQGKQL